MEGNQPIEAAAESAESELESHSPQVADWEQAHEELVRLARNRAGLDHEEARWLLVALRSSVHVRLGFGSFSEYIERLFGYSPRFVRERLRVAEALETLPELDSALAEGELSWTALRELTRVATPRTETEWLEATRGLSAREVERRVAGHRPGNRPSDSPDGTLRRHVLRLELSAEALAAFREALARLRRDAGGLLDDDAAVLLMARQVLGGPNDESRSSYQVCLTVCKDCRRGHQHASGELLEVQPQVVEMAGCDAQQISVNPTATHGGHGPKRATQSIPPSVRRLVMRRDGGRCVVPGCRHARFLDVHHVDPRAEGGQHDPENLAVLCGAHHRAVHRGQLSITGRASTGLEFRHADGTRYGGAVSARSSDTRSSAFRALCNMGFRETEARRALERAAPHVGPAATIESVLRRALAELTPAKRASPQVG